jgi:hypothetical protein
MPDGKAGQERPEKEEGDNTHPAGVGGKAAGERAPAIGGMGQGSSAYLVPGNQRRQRRAAERGLAGAGGGGGGGAPR